MAGITNWFWRNTGAEVESAYVDHEDVEAFRKEFPSVSEEVAAAILAGMGGNVRTERATKTWKVWRA